ncbi:DUF2510 domain-containing protein [Streptomyces sp. NPDC096152]|uniref:DUF2510 domain-containing protein n=1 Tax=Streptomyces sp. NPDC096152 TaxID=3366078 RepID=UPI003819F324
MTPPPGWYGDPTAPHLERWWDGTSWTEHRRAPEERQGPRAPQAPPVPRTFGQPAAPEVPPAAGPPAPPARRPRAKAVALAGAGAVLAAAIVTGALLLGHGDEGGTEAKNAPTTPSAVPTSAPHTASRPASAGASATDDPSVVVDQLNGITLPLPDGWEKPQDVADEDVVMTTHGTYDCPAGVGLCRHGLVLTRTATAADGTSPETLARHDIEDAADAAFDRDAIGERPFGGITSHQVVRSGQIAVAGRAGYFVRWRVRTAKGPGGYVESLAFPSSVGTEAPVVVRFVFDAGPDGPPPADMDRITRGIRPVGDAATGGGVGSSIGPSS